MVPLCFDKMPLVKARSIPEDFVSPPIPIIKRELRSGEMHRTQPHTIIQLVIAQLPSLGNQ
jgi:hypothetical protein